MTLRWEQYVSLGTFSGNTQKEKLDAAHLWRVQRRAAGEKLEGESIRGLRLMKNSKPE